MPAIEPFSGLAINPWTSRSYPVPEFAGRVHMLRMTCAGPGWGSGALDCAQAIRNTRTSGEVVAGDGLQSEAARTARRWPGGGGGPADRSAAGHASTGQRLMRMGLSPVRIRDARADCGTGRGCPVSHSHADRLEFCARVRLAPKRGPCVVSSLSIASWSECAMAQQPPDGSYPPGRFLRKMAAAAWRN